MREIHLLCNAHLDPVWLWEWPEGAAEALATFRSAAELCREHPDLVFSQNEALLYQWVEENDPRLFSRIRRLVRQGRWRVLGGWFLQPDCNMPSGESFVRQIQWGRRYFRDKFGVRPQSAANLDSFGHSRGLVQILARAGYRSYLFCRPRPDDCPLPGEDFAWVGYDGSRILAHRAADHYNSPLGQAAQKITRWIERHPGEGPGLVLWGVGNHGGGPSRADLEAIARCAEEDRREQLLHSSAEAYFRSLQRSGRSLPEHAADLNPWAVGCYTSQILVKQSFRRLENEFYLTEKMLCHAALRRLLPYPRPEMEQALYDLLLSQFHDILPGSSTEEVERWALQLMGHGLEILQRLKVRCFFALGRGQPPAREGTFPILAYNPHPWAVRGIWECELNLPDPNRGPELSLPRLRLDGAPVPCQLEKESSNLALDWRKRVVFAGELAAGRMSRFDCSFTRGRPAAAEEPEREGEAWVFRNPELEVRVNARTGLLDSYVCRGAPFLAPGAFRPLVLKDDGDPWGMRVRGFGEVVGQFELAAPREGTALSGASEQSFGSVRVVEDGEVRTVVEAVLTWGRSHLCLQYKLPRRGCELEVCLRVLWNEKNRMLKLAVPTLLRDARCLGQAPFGVKPLVSGGEENVCQRWQAVVSRQQGLALTCVNDGTYGSDFRDGELRLSLLRSPAYAAHPFRDRPFLEHRRFIPRIDQGERCFRFWFCGGGEQERLESVDREALAHGEQPFLLCCFPAGRAGAEARLPAVELSDSAVQMSAFSPLPGRSRGLYLIRLYEPTGRPRSAEIRLPALGIRRALDFGPFEVKTLLLSARRRSLRETNLLGER